MESETSQDIMNEIKFIELSRENDLLHIKLSKKDQIIEEMKLQQMQEIEQLENRLNETLHKNKLFEVNNGVSPNEIIGELQDLVNRQNQLEQLNKRLAQEASEIKGILSGDLSISEEEYKKLEMKENLTLRNILEIKFYRMLADRRSRPTPHSELTFLKRKLKEANDANEESLKDIEKLREYILQLRTENNAIAVKDDLNLQQKCLSLMNDNEDLSSHKAELTNSLNREITKNKILEDEIKSLKCQLSEHQSKLVQFERSLSSANSIIETLKVEKREMWSNLLENRETNRKVYQEKLEEQLTANKTCLQEDLMRTRAEHKAMYEREISILRNQLNKAERERDQSAELHRSILQKYERLLSEGNCERKTLEGSCQDSAARALFMQSEIERLRLLNDDLRRRSKEYEHKDAEKSEKLILYKTELETTWRKICAQDSLNEEIDLLKEKLERLSREQPHSQCRDCERFIEENKLLRADLGAMVEDNEEFDRLNQIVNNMGDF